MKDKMVDDVTSVTFSIPCRKFEIFFTMLEAMNRFLDDYTESSTALFGNDNSIESNDSIVDPIVRDVVIKSYNVDPSIDNIDDVIHTGITGIHTCITGIRPRGNVANPVCLSDMDIIEVTDLSLNISNLIYSYDSNMENVIKDLVDQGTMYFVVDWWVLYGFMREVMNMWDVINQDNSGITTRAPTYVNITLSKYKSMCGNFMKYITMLEYISPHNMANVTVTSDMDRRINCLHGA